MPKNSRIIRQLSPGDTDSRTNRKSILRYSGEKEVERRWRAKTLRFPARNQGLSAGAKNSDSDGDAEVGWAEGWKGGEASRRYRPCDAKGFSAANNEKSTHDPHPLTPLLLQNHLGIPIDRSSINVERSRRKLPRFSTSSLRSRPRREEIYANLARLEAAEDILRARSTERDPFGEEPRFQFPECCRFRERIT
ncbi:hypothetical protein KM043_001672 [Ampulex compressa]|nr:hypothetical protein KM043_001672 [Ampulex compressa]